MYEFRFGITAADYERSISFYRDGLGLSIIRSWNRSATDKGTLLQCGNGVIEIVPSDALHPPAIPAGIWLYIEVQDADAYFKIVSEKDIPVLLEPRTEPWGHKRFIIQDPDGVKIGMYHVVNRS